ncbi:hypothetical protein ACFPYI_01890 [Halomarina salina]|uniref:Methyl-accepting chemotaxis protein n=1 Tax=Halomarina salina TaxID=1872699 RepID=A0ABD5RHQ9_9EURY|nr:hypothetical protein [Halomarina salina]
MVDNINGLEVEITADADEAVEEIERVTEALERLSAAAEDANRALERLGGGTLHLETQRQGDRERTTIEAATETAEELRSDNFDTQ